MKTIILILKGFIIGLAKIIPGVSGAVLAISMGLYDKALNAITEFTNDVKSNLVFLLPIGIGIIIAMIIGANLVTYFLNNYYLITMLFFIGLITGSIKTIYNKTSKNKKMITISTISFIIMTLISISNINNTYIKTNTILDNIMYFISGLIDATGTVIPGLSSTALLMILGTYNTILDTISNITNINLISTNLNIIFFYSIGLILGIILISIFINYMFKKRSTDTFSFIFGIIISSILLLLLKTFNQSFTLYELIIGLILFAIGIFITKQFKEKQ